MFRQLQMPQEVSPRPAPLPPVSVPVLSKRLLTLLGIIDCVNTIRGIVGGASYVTSILERKALENPPLSHTFANGVC